MATIIDLRVQGLDFSDYHFAETLYNRWGVDLRMEDGLTLMSIYVEDDLNVVNYVTDTVKQIQSVYPHIKINAVQKDLVSLSDIAARVGYSKQAIQKWTVQKELNFPLPISTIGSGQKIWDWLDVCEWLFDAKSIDMDEDLPTHNQVIQIDACLAGIPDKTQLEWEKVGSHGQPTRSVATQAIYPVWDVAHPHVRFVDWHYPSVPVEVPSSVENESRRSGDAYAR